MIDKETMDFPQTLKTALDKWVELTGVTPDQKSFTIKIFGSNGLSEIDLHQGMKEYQESLETDSTGVTTAMLLRHDYLIHKENMSFSAEEVLSGDEKIQQKLRLLTELDQLLHGELITKAIDEFKGNLKSACDHYGVDEKETEKMLDDKKDLAFLRSKVFSCIKDLGEYQFSRGKCDTGTPKFYTKVLKFPNINLAVKFAATNDEPFIAIAIIKDYFNILFSHFVFIVKNGDNIYVLTNQVKWEHPKQEELISGRRGGIRFAERTENYWGIFPFEELLDELEGETEEEMSKGSVLKAVSELPPQSVIWLSMMFERLRVRYWEEKVALKELTYFAGAVNPDLQSQLQNISEMRKALPDPDNKEKQSEINSKNLPALTQLPKITLEDVSVEATKDDWDQEPTRQYEWMEKRYEHKLSDFVLNPVITDQKLLEAKTKDGGQLRSQTDDPHGSFFAFRKDERRNMQLALKGQGKLSVSALSSASDLLLPNEIDFGSLAELKKGQRWIARHNKAQMTQYYAHKEFRERSEEIEKWFAKAVKKRRDALIEIGATGTFIVEETQSPNSGFKSGWEQKENNILIMQKGKYPQAFTYPRAYIADEDSNFHVWYVYCPITGKKATIWSILKPRCANSLAKVLGMEIKDLPDVLQTWNLDEQYSGNHLLNNLDPMEWCISDPWKSLEFCVIVAFSRNGIKKVRKEIGLGPLDFDTISDSYS